MMRWLRAPLRVLGLLSCLAAAHLHAETDPARNPRDDPADNPPHVLEEAGALLGEMSELDGDYLHTHGHRGMTPEKVETLARRTARKMARNRDALAGLMPALRPESAFAVKLARFLARWPDEAAFKMDLLAYDGGDGGKAGADIQSLLFLAPDKRRKWKTLFPLFRP